MASSKNSGCWIRPDLPAGALEQLIRRRLQNMRRFICDCTPKFYLG